MSGNSHQRAMERGAGKRSAGSIQSVRVPILVEQREASAPIGKWKRIAKKLKHRWWGYVVSLLAFYLATLTPDLERALVLAFAVAVASITFHLTDFAAKKMKRTVPVGAAFVAVAVLLYFAPHWWDGRSASHETPSQAKAVARPSPTVLNGAVEARGLASRLQGLKATTKACKKGIGVIGSLNKNDFNGLSVIGFGCGVIAPGKKNTLKNVTVVAPNAGPEKKP